MSEPPRHEELAARLLAGVEALRDGRAAEAVAPLAEVAHDPDLAAADDLIDVRCRALGLLGQALLAEDRPDEAAPVVDEALRLVRTLGDPDGLRDLRALHSRVVEARQRAASQAHAAARSARLAEVPLSEIRERVTDPAALADVLVRKANAELDAGRPETAEAVAREALALGGTLGDVRTRVLARLTIARARPHDADDILLEAWTDADRADEFNLVGAVARAAELAKVALPVQVGPDMGRRQ